MARIALPTAALLVLLASPSTALARQDLPNRGALHLAPESARRAPIRIAPRPDRPREVARFSVSLLSPAREGTFRTWSPLLGDWSDRAFTLVAERALDLASTGLDTVRFWVATDEWNAGTVPPGAVSALADAAALATPPGSADPGSGVIANTAAVYGPSIDTDGDGKLDVLLFDIQDDYPSPGGILVLGYFQPADYDDAAPPGAGNAADVLYMDTDPHLSDFPDLLPETFARVHGEQTAWPRDPDEHPFVVRALGEWARLHNGYRGPGRWYLDYPTEHGIGFFFWSASHMFVGDVQRGALFASYLEEQFGAGFMAALALSQESGPDGVRAVLATHGDGRSLVDVVFDFHLANFLNEPSVDPRYAHVRDAYRDARAVSTFSVNGGLQTQLDPVGFQFNGGGVQYVTWENVRDLSVQVQTVSGGPIRLAAVLEYADGAVEVRPVETDETNDIHGAFERATLVIGSAVVDDPAHVTAVGITSSWAGTAVSTEYVAYDGGAVSNGAPFVPLGPDWEQFTRFEVPSGLELHALHLAPFFSNQFYEYEGGPPVGSPDDPRDFTLRLYGDRGGRPGDTIFETVLDDPRFFFYTGESIQYFEFTLFDRPDRPGSLPPTIHVGLSEAGSDDNVLVLGVADHADQNVSHLGGPFGAVRDTVALWDVTVRLPDATLYSFDGTAIPIRALFRQAPVNTGSEPGVLPMTAAELRVYPNPARNGAVIEIAGVEPESREVAVFDLLGRRVASERLERGTTQVRLIVADWAPGIYIARSGRGTARPFVVVR